MEADSTVRLTWYAESQQTGISTAFAQILSTNNTMVTIRELSSGLVPCPSAYAGSWSHKRPVHGNAQSALTSAIGTHESHKRP
jgi:hypothetical protein